VKAGSLCISWGPCHLSETRLVECEAPCRGFPWHLSVLLPEVSLEGKEKKGHFILFYILGQLQGLSWVREQCWTANRQRWPKIMETQGRSYSFFLILPTLVFAEGHSRSPGWFLDPQSWPFLFERMSESLILSHRLGVWWEGKASYGGGWSPQAPHTSDLSLSLKHCPLLLCTFFLERLCWRLYCLWFCFWNGL